MDSGTFTQGGQTSPLMRYEGEDLAEDELADLTGRYYPRELELWLDVRLEDDGLVIHRMRGEPIELTHRSDLTCGAFPFAQIEFQGAANGDITGLLAGNGRTKGVLFSRQ